MRGHRQLRAQRVKFIEIEAEGAPALQHHGALHHIRSDERIAVAIAADPAAHPQERRQRLRTALLAQTVLQPAVQARHLTQERVIVEGETVGHLVEHRELAATEQIGLPQRHHRPA